MARGQRRRRRRQLRSERPVDVKRKRAPDERRGWFAAAAIGLIGLAARQRRRGAVAAAAGPPTAGVTSLHGPHWPPRSLTERGGRWPKSPDAAALCVATPPLPSSAFAKCLVVGGGGGGQVGAVTAALSHAGPRSCRAHAPPPAPPPPRWDAPPSPVGGHMRCFSSKKSLILLSCIAAAIVLVCGGMVVTAYVSWKHRKEVATTVQVAGSAADHATLPLDHGRRPAGAAGNDRKDDSPSSTADSEAAARANVVLQDVLKLRACANRRLLELKRSQDEMQHPVAAIRRGQSHLRYAVDSDDTTGTDDEGDGIVSSGSGDGPRVPAHPGARPSAAAASDQGSSSERRDACEHALRCSDDPFLLEYMRKLADLPTCPCFYPESTSSRPAGSGGGSSSGGSSGGGHRELWDDSKQRYFYWKQAPYTSHQLSVYHSGADRCIWSVASPSSGTLAAQSCCYDAQSRLLTRGPGAGTPMLVSPDISPELNYALDRLPWLTCGGDWTRYNRVRPPNNGRRCHEVPDQIEYLYLALKAKDT